MRLALLILLASTFCVFAPTRVHRGVSWQQPKVAAGGGGVSFSDNFDRADSDSLGANWTEADGDEDIFSNTMRLSEGSFGDNFAIYTGTALNTINGYIKVSKANAGQFPQIPFRYVNASTEFYFLEFGASTVDWYHSTAIGGTDTQINASSGSISWASESLGITWTGTGTSTEVRIWLTVTADAPTSASSWDGGAADVTFTDNPGNPADAGNFLGLGGVQSAADTITFDNFFGGDIP